MQVAFHYDPTKPDLPKMPHFRIVGSPVTPLLSCPSCRPVRLR
jgi:hypothetical protein